MLNTRNPCQALDLNNNSNVSEISLLAVANRKSNQNTVLKKISTTDNLQLSWEKGEGPRERERKRERKREGG